MTTTGPADGVLVPGHDLDADVFSGVVAGRQFRGSVRAWCVHDHRDADQTDGRAHEVIAVGPELVGDNPHISDPARHPPYVARIRPKFGSGWKMATNPYPGRATPPAPTQPIPRCSRIACHTSQAPPISSTAATTYKTTERMRLGG